ncbi:MAG: protease [Rhodococcus sp.]|nr:protease [Rhodococcus sp. (in: high G+C Gram-positive bacteria)]
MRNVLARRVAAVGAAATLLWASGAVIASADPVETPTITQLAADELPAELVEAIGRDLRISPQEYLDRAARAQLLGSYADAFRSERPADFAGAWIGRDGQSVVAVTSSDAAARAAADGYVTQIVPISADTLEQILSEVHAWIASLPREISSHINSASIDVLNNQIIVDVANSPIGRALNLPALLAHVKVMVSPFQGGPTEPGPMGGDTYISTVEPLEHTPTDQITVCSLGFNAVNGDGSAVNISAGHCNPVPGSSSPVYLPNRDNVAASTRIGQFRASSVGAAGDGLDYSVIALNGAGVAAGLDRPVIRGANGKTLTITGTARPVVGAPICKSGQTSSFTCGVVAAEHVESQLYVGGGKSRTISGFAGTACTLAGDSGGAIVTGTLALGITSGSNSSGAPSCLEANFVLAPYGGTAGLGIPLNEIINTVGTGIKVRTTGN